MRAVYYKEGRALNSLVPAKEYIFNNIPQMVPRDKCGDVWAQVFSKISYILEHNGIAPAAWFEHMKAEGLYAIKERLGSDKVLRILCDFINGDLVLLHAFDKKVPYEGRRQKMINKEQYKIANDRKLRFVRNKYFEVVI